MKKEKAELEALIQIQDTLNKPDLSLLTDDELRFWAEMQDRCFLNNRHTELVYTEEEMNRIEFLIAKAKGVVSGE